MNKYKWKYMTGPGIEPGTPHHLSQVLYHLDIQADIHGPSSPNYHTYVMWYMHFYIMHWQVNPKVDAGNCNCCFWQDLHYYCKQYVCIWKLIYIHTMQCFHYGMDMFYQFPWSKFTPLMLLFAIQLFAITLKYPSGISKFTTLL